MSNQASLPLDPNTRYLATPTTETRREFHFMGAERKECPSNYGCHKDGTLTVWPFDFEFEIYLGEVIGTNSNCGTRYIITVSPKLSKARAIKIARDRVGQLYKFGKGQWCFNTFVPSANASTTSNPTIYATAHFNRSQALIDEGRKALGKPLLMFEGGNWQDYL